MTQPRYFSFAATALAMSCALTLSSAPAAAQSASAPVVYLNQGWSQADREMYYQISQGSVVMSYDIFLQLEAAGSQDLFRSEANSDRYGLVSQPANPLTNPDGLPIAIRSILRPAFPEFLLPVMCATAPPKA